MPALQNLKGPGTCLFCRRSPPVITMTKEHIWSDWLKNILPASDFRFESSDGIVDAAGNRKYPDKVQQKKPGAVHRRQSRVVCRECNNGWMKGIVDAAKPFAEKLIKGEPITLGPKEQIALATWSALSSIIVNQETLSRHVFSRNDIAYMYLHRAVPSHWHIEIGRYFFRGRSDFSDNNCAFVLHDQNTGEHTTSLAIHSTATILGHLYIKFYCGDPSNHPLSKIIPPNLHQPFLRPIWPPGRLVVLSFPPPPQFVVTGILTPGGGPAYDLALRVREFMLHAAAAAGIPQQAR
jgi:hypothetical protein